MNTIENIETTSATALAATPVVWWKSVLRFPLTALVLALASLMLALGGLTLLVNMTPLGDMPRDAAIVFNGIMTPLIAIVVYKLVIRRLGEAPRDDLPFDARFRDALTGTAGAFALMTAIVAVAALLGGYRISGWGGSTSWVKLLFLAGVQAALFEELVVRGIIFRFLEEFAGSWAALILSALLFGFGHAYNPNATPLSSLAIALEAGVMLGGAYMLTRNLWLAVGIHFGWNVTQGYVWDVPVSGLNNDGLLDAHPAGSDLISGGAFGLEASVVAMVLATAVGIWLVVLAARRGHIVQPWWVRRRTGAALPA